MNSWIEVSEIKSGKNDINARIPQIITFQRWDVPFGFSIAECTQQLSASIVDIWNCKYADLNMNQY